MTPPGKIWLQWHGDGEPQPEPCATPSESDVTWASDKVFKQDVEYVRVPEASGEAALIRWLAGRCGTDERTTMTLAARKINRMLRC